LITASYELTWYGREQQKYDNYDDRVVEQSVKESWPRHVARQ